MGRVPPEGLGSLSVKRPLMAPLREFREIVILSLLEKPGLTMAV